MKSLSQLVGKFKQIRRDYTTLKQNAPRLMGIIAVKEIKQNFDRQAFFTEKRWKPRKKSTNRAYDKRTGVKGSVFNSKSKILWQTGNYHDNIKYNPAGSRVDVGVNQNLVPYAPRHNEGLKGMPKRKAIGWHPYIGMMIKRDMKQRTRQIFKNI